MFFLRPDQSGGREKPREFLHIPDRLEAVACVPQTQGLGLAQIDQRQLGFIAYGDGGDEIAATVPGLLATGDGGGDTFAGMTLSFKSHIQNFPTPFPIWRWRCRARDARWTSGLISMARLFA